MKTKNKILFVLGILLLPCGLGLLLLYKVLKKKANRYYTACLLPRFMLWLLQPHFKQDAFILFDTNSINTQLIDNYTLFQEMKKRNIKAYYLCYKLHPQYHQFKKLHGKNIIGFKNIDLLFFTLFFKLLKTKAILESFRKILNSEFKKIKKNKYTQHIFTQHGITFFKDNFIDEKNYSKRNYNKITISNNFEKEIFKKVGFKDDDFISSGLARWDLLSEKTKEKSIFVYFTHRFTFWEKDKKNYKDSLYFQNLEKLLKSLQKLDVKVYVAIHHAVRDWINDFTIPGIIFVDEFEIDKIKNKTNLLITDYSSMCFEYMIKDKPVIFYHLDENDKFLCEFDLKMQEDIKKKDKLIFNVFGKEKDVLEKVKKYIENGFELEKENKKIAKRFFFHKKNICEKIINQLIK